MPEGEVRITAANLPRLDGTKQYVAWVVNSESNQYQRVGAFNTAESTGAVRYENVLPDAIPNNHWNLLLVTIESSATPAKPSDKHSIAGVFPRPDSEPLPGILPNTGGVPDGEPVASGHTFVLSGQWAVIASQSPVASPRSSAESSHWLVVGGADWLVASGLAALTGIVGFGAGYVVRRRRPSAAHWPPTPGRRPHLTDQ
jgi:hypothetical protein